MEEAQKPHHDVVRVSVADAQYKRRHTISSAASGEGLQGLIDVVLIVRLDPLVKLRRVHLNGRQFPGLPLDLVDGFCIANYLYHPDLVAGCQARVGRHPQVHALHVPDMVHNRYNCKGIEN